MFDGKFGLHVAGSDHQLEMMDDVELLDTFLERMICFTSESIAAIVNF